MEKQVRFVGDSSEDISSKCSAGSTGYAVQSKILSYVQQRKKQSPPASSSTSMGSINENVDDHTDEEAEDIPFSETLSTDKTPSTGEIPSTGESSSPGGIVLIAGSVTTTKEISCSRDYES